MSSNGWESLGRWGTIASILGGIALLIQVIRWSISNADTNQLAKLIAWALVGKSDENVLSSVIENSKKLIITTIVWTILVGGIWVIAVLGITIVFLALEIEVSGTWDALKQYAVIGAVLGAISGIIISVFRISRQNSSSI